MHAMVKSYVGSPLLELYYSNKNVSLKIDLKEPRCNCKHSPVEKIYFLSDYKNVYILLLVEGICTEISYRCLLQFVIPVSTQRNACSMTTLRAGNTH